MSKTKLLYLTRHAHRDVSDRTQDNGLSAKGREQAEALRQHFKKICEEKGVPLRFISSPKRRCVETLTPLAAEFNFVIEIDDRLDENHGGEDLAGFLRRISSFLVELNESKGLIFACSHGDWIPEAMRLLVDQEIDLKKGAFTEVDISTQPPKLIQVVQSLKDSK